MTGLENQNTYIVKCTEKIVFGFQDNLCSLGRLENQIEHFVIMRFWDPYTDVQFF